MRLVTAVSLAANVIGLVGASTVVRRKGIAQVVRAIRPPATQPADYARLARERFADLPGAPVVLAGDSQAQNCPAGEVFGPIAVRGIGGMTIADLRTWIGQVLDDPELCRLVLWIGTNDVGTGRSTDQISGDMDALLGDVAGKRPDVETVVLSIPPLTDRRADAAVANEALRSVTEARGCRFVELTSVLTGPAMAADGTHVSPLGYGRLRELADQVAG